MKEMVLNTFNWCLETPKMHKKLLEPILCPYRHSSLISELVFMKKQENLLNIRKSTELWLRISERILIKNSSKLVRLKALDLYFAFFATYEHLRAFLEHLRYDEIYAQNQHFGVLFSYIVIFQLAIDAREVLVDARKMQKCKVHFKGF